MKKVLLFLCVVGNVLTSSCMAGPPYIVDDPGTTEFRRFYLELDYLYNRNAGGEMHQAPFITFAYGLRQNIEIGAQYSYLLQRPAGSPLAGGGGDLLPYVKWRFQEENAHRPQWALVYQTKLPTASVDRGFGTGATDHTLYVAAAKSFRRTTLFSNLGYNFLGGSDGRNNLFYGVGLTYQLTETLTVGAQLYGNTANAPGGSGELGWGLGLTYNFAPDRTFLLQAGRSERGFSDFNLYAGVAFTFGK